MIEPKAILLLPGDGIGPEVTEQAVRLMNWMREHRRLQIVVEEAPFGGASIDIHGVPLTDAVRARALAADAVIMGAVGGPRWDGAPRAHRPEAALLDMRSAMNVFANLRPVRVSDPLAERSPLKREIVAGTDILIVRELTGGVYFGEPKETVSLHDGRRRAVDTQVYTSDEIERVARVAFEAARARSGRLCSVEKSNVMETGQLWRDVVGDVHRQDYADITLVHMLADNAAMQLIRDPRQFDVILADNLFGDMLSDEAAMLTGSLGMLPSASLGAIGKPGLYEPIHGSAPDIAGQGIANPCAAILSFAMALRHSLDRGDLADEVQAAVDSTIAAGFRTLDLGGVCSSSDFGTALIKQMSNIL